MLSMMQKMERKICGVNDCNGQHNYLLHVEHGKATVNIFMVLDEEDEEAEEDKPASEDEEEEESPGARLMRGIQEAGRSSKGEIQGAQEDSSTEEEARKEVTICGAGAGICLELEPEPAISKMGSLPQPRLKAGLWIRIHLNED